MKSRSLLAFNGLLLVCLGQAAVLRQQRSVDTRALLSDRRRLVQVCAHTGPDCKEGCMAEEDCPIDKVEKEIKVDCEDIKKELSDGDEEDPCAGVLPGDFEKCKQELDQTLKDELPPQEKEYCECLAKELQCNDEKKAACAELPQCGPFRVPDLVQDAYVCDFGGFDKVTEGNFFETCLEELAREVKAAEARIEKAQEAINKRKEECVEFDKICNKECDDCKPKCLVIENTKKLSCEAYDKCIKTATDALKKKMKEAREQAEKLNTRWQTIAEIKCEAEADKKGAGADAAEKCKASIDKNICPIAPCKAPEPEECDGGDPLKCTKKADEAEWPEDTCGEQPTTKPTKKPTPTPTWVPPTKEPPGPVPPVPPTKEPPVPPCEEPKNCKRVPAEEAAIKCKTSPKFAEKCKCTCKPGPVPPVPPPPPPPVPPTPPPSCKKDCNAPNGACVDDECVCKQGFCGENCETADCNPVCPDGKTPLPFDNCGPLCTEGKCPDGITCGPNCGPEPCKPKPGFGVCPDGKQCKANPGGTNCGPKPCKPKPGFGVCPDGLTCKKDKDGSNCGPVVPPVPPPPVPPGGCECICQKSGKDATCADESKPEMKCEEEPEAPVDPKEPECAKDEDCKEGEICRVNAPRKCEPFKPEDRDPKEVCEEEGSPVTWEEANKACAGKTGNQLKNCLADVCITGTTDIADITPVGPPPGPECTSDRDCCKDNFCRNTKCMRRDCSCVIASNAGDGGANGEYCLDKNAHTETYRHKNNNQLILKRESNDQGRRTKGQQGWYAQCWRVQKNNGNYYRYLRNDQKVMYNVWDVTSKYCSQNNGERGPGRCPDFKCKELAGFSKKETNNCQNTPKPDAPAGPKRFCISEGDPHIFSFTGGHADFYETGEYNYWDCGGYKISACMKPLGRATGNTQVAIAKGGQVMKVNPSGALSPQGTVSGVTVRKLGPTAYVIIESQSLSLELAAFNAQGRWYTSMSFMYTGEDKHFRTCKGICFAGGNFQGFKQNGLTDC